MRTKIDQKFAATWKEHEVVIAAGKRERMRGLRSLFVLVLVIMVSLVRADDEELVAVSLPSSCTSDTGCVECLEEAIKECRETGFTIKYRCEESINKTHTHTVYRYESCVPAIEEWVAMVRFDVLMFVGAVMSLMYVRRRKQQAKNQLVMIVNRS